MVRKFEKSNLSPGQNAVKKIQSPNPTFMQISEIPNTNKL